MKNSSSLTLLLTLSFDLKFRLHSSAYSALYRASLKACNQPQLLCCSVFGPARSRSQLQNVSRSYIRQNEIQSVIFKKRNSMPVFHSSNLVYRKVLVPPSGEICISFPKVAKNCPNRSGKWWNCRKILSFYP